MGNAFSLDAVEWSAVGGEVAALNVVVYQEAAQIGWSSDDTYTGDPRSLICVIDGEVPDIVLESCSSGRRWP